VVNVTNGQRFVTYAIKGRRGSGTIGFNGGAARLGHIGDTVIILAYGQFSDEEARTFRPRIVLVDEKNRAVER
jgi:aspartate 1-decarboxylase